MSGHDKSRIEKQDALIQQIKLTKYRLIAKYGPKVVRHWGG